MPFCWRSRRTNVVASNTGRSDFDPTSLVPSLVPPKFAKNVALFKAAEDGTESVTAVLRALAGTQAVSCRHPSSLSSDPALRKRAAALYGEQKNGRTALHVAIEKGSGATRALIGAGGPLNKPDQAGWTPVHLAAFHGRSECLQMLLNAGAEPNYLISSGTGKGKTAVQLAADQGNVDCVLILLAVGARSKPMTDLIGTAIANAPSKKPVAKRPTRADATTAIQSWRAAHATRLQRTTDAALSIQAWYRGARTRRWFLEVQRAHRLANERAASFGQIRQLCRSDENGADVDRLLHKYVIDQKGASDGGPNLERQAQFARKASDGPKPAAVTSWQPKKFYKKHNDREVFVWNSPEPELGKIVGVVGPSAQLVVQGHSSNAEISTVDGDWIRIANPVDTDSKVPIFGTGEAWCLAKANTGTSQSQSLPARGQQLLLTLQPHVDYTAMGDGAWRSWGFEIVNLEKPPSSTGCSHYFSASSTVCFFCNEPRKSPAGDPVTDRLTPVSRAEMDAMVVPMVSNCYEELLAEALNGGAVQIMRLLCRNTGADVAAPCALLLDQGYRAIVADAQKNLRSAPKCSHSHAMETSSYAGGGYTRGYICDGCHGHSAAGHNHGSRERWFCSLCHEDLCFVCHTKPGAADSAMPKGNAMPSVLQAAAMQNKIQMIEVFLDEATDACKQATFPQNPENSPIVQSCKAGAEAAAILLLDRCAGLAGKGWQFSPLTERNRRGAVLSVATNLAIQNHLWGVLAAIQGCKYDFQRAAVDALPSEPTAVSPSAYGGISLYIRSLLFPAALSTATDKLHPCLQSADIGASNRLLCSRGKAAPPPPAWPPLTVDDLDSVRKLSKEIGRWRQKASSEMLRRSAGEIVANIDHMIHLGFTIDAASSNGVTAVMLAAQHGIPWLVKELLDRGAQDTLVDAQNKTVWWHAAHCGNLQCLEELAISKHNALVGSFLSTRISNPSTMASVAQVLTSVVPSGHLGMGYAFQQGPSPLEAAVNSGQHNAAKFLLQIGCPAGNIGALRQSRLVQAGESALASAIIMAEANKTIKTLRSTSQQTVRLINVGENDSTLKRHVGAARRLMELYQEAKAILPPPGGDIMTPLGKMSCDTPLDGQGQVAHGNTTVAELEAMLLTNEVSRTFQIDSQRVFLKKNSSFLVATSLPWHLEAHARLYLDQVQGDMAGKLVGHLVKSLHRKVLTEYWLPIIQHALKSSSAGKLEMIAECIDRLPAVESGEARGRVALDLDVEKIVKDQHSKHLLTRNEACFFIAKVFPDRARCCDICFDAIDKPTNCCKQTGGEHYKKIKCDHEFCRGCLVNWITASISDRNVQIRCPEDGCAFVFSGDDIKRIAGETIYKKFTAIGNENYQARIREVASDPNMAAWIEKNTRVCPNCHVIIERSAGCNSMRCPCGSTFSWTTARSVTSAATAASTSTPSTEA